MNQFPCAKIFPLICGFLFLLILATEGETGNFLPQVQAGSTFFPDPKIPREDLDFFEAKIRPVLVEHCYSCHNTAKSADGGLALDYRAALLKGGDSGAVIVAKNPQASRLVAVMKHEIEGVKMPQGGIKLPDHVIKDFCKWIEMGAPDPRDKPPTAAELAKATSWEAVFAKRKEWWSFQNVRKPLVPTPKNRDWSEHPIDRFVLARLETMGLEPAKLAEKRDLLRRVTFDLTGLPPTPQDLEAFLGDQSADAFERVVDRLLGSPRFGEHWARHWMDLVRYSESHGSQGDPELPEAWRYRDYLIRAWNSDVPYDQLIREHLAGDLLPNPRLNQAENLNESALGTAQLRMVELGYIPVDALEDQVKVVDNQIDVISKTFLALTVSCARCHDHKFDPISQKDFYSLYGTLVSGRPGQILIDTPEILGKNRDALGQLKERIREKISNAWMVEAKKTEHILNNLVTLKKQIHTIEEQKKSLIGQIAAIEEPARQKVVASRGQKSVGPLPVPFSRWSFEGDARDGIGGNHGQLLDGAIVRSGRLVLDGKTANVKTGLLDRDLSERTIEAWVALSNNDQRGGGVIGLETTEGRLFDSIVFGEIEPGKWLAGSDFFNRTQNPGGPVEAARIGELIHVAIVYEKDGKITFYRNGQPYGQSYRKAPIQNYAKGKSRFLFGQRLSGINPPLAGEIEEARVYAKPLTESEIQASFKAGHQGVSVEELSRALTPVEGAKRQALLRELGRVGDLLDEIQSKTNSGGAWMAAVDAAKKETNNPLHAWGVLSEMDAKLIAGNWENLASNHKRQSYENATFNLANFQMLWDLQKEDFSYWFRSGIGLPKAPVEAGDFCLEVEGDVVLRGIYPRGLPTHSLSRKHNAVLTSPRFKIETDNISVRALGEHSVARIVIENYPIGNGGIYPAARLDRDEMGWIRLDTSYRKGSMAYVEFVTAGDYPSGSVPGTGSRPYQNGRAYFLPGQIVAHNKGETPRDLFPSLDWVYDGKLPHSSGELARMYSEMLQEAVAAWRDKRLSPQQSAFLDYFVRRGLLPTSISQLSAIAPLVEEYRKLEREIPVPRRAPGFHEAGALNQPLFVRGQHTKPSDPVPRSGLSVLGGKPFGDTQSGRLELAQQFASASNPLTSRVMVNRIWHHLFGKGIVSTVDNFGLLGANPTHPELLDYLASRFVGEGWSMKKVIRLVVTSKTYQLSANPSQEASQKDPSNDYLSHRTMRRLNAEQIRDALLSVSGQLDTKMYGFGVNVYYVGKTEGGGPKGPLDGDRRRSVYQRIRRNAHNPFLEAFDAPKPATTRGNRDSTNVPLQSLTMLNDPFVIDQSAKWAKALVSENLPEEKRIRSVFVKTLGREATVKELDQSKEYLADLAREYKLNQDPDGTGATQEKVWQDFVHSIFCLKEFIYVH